MEKISVIVPVYKVENYLEKCVNSLINQTYRNLEIILVDDGSPDSCGVICEQFASEHDNVIALHKENGGLSDARNFGLKIASGVYISFVDSDDYVDIDYFEYLYSMVKQYDSQMSMCGMYGEDEEGNFISLHTKTTNKSGCLSGKDALCKVLYQEGFDVSAWGKLYKRSLFDNLKFKQGILYEDFEIIDKTMLSCVRVAYGCEQKYHYVQHSGSIMSQGKFDNRMLYLIELSENMRQKYSDDTVLRKAVIWRDVYSKLIVLNRLIRTGSSFAECEDLIKKLRSDLFAILADNRVRMKYKVVMIILRILPGQYYKEVAGKTDRR